MIEFNPRKQYSEAMIQAEFYQACKEAGLKCYLEYKAKLNGSRGSIFDAVVTDNGYIVAIIEVKSYKGSQLKGRKKWLRSKQAWKYNRFDVPVILISKLEDIKPTVNSIKNFLVRDPVPTP